MRSAVLYLILLMSFTGHVTCGQTIVGITGGLLNAGYFDRSETPHYSGEYESPVTFSTTAFIKQRNHRDVNAGVSLSFVNRQLDLTTNYGGQAVQTIQKDHYNLNYLYLSLFPEFSFGEKLKLNLSVGPSLGFLVNAHVNGVSSTRSASGVDSSWSYAGKADFKGMEVRLQANVGLEIPLSKKFSLTIDNSYSTGITNVASGEWGSYAEFVSTYDMSLTIGIIYRLDNFRFSLLPNPRNHQVR